MQRPGEVVFIPRWWHHATINIGDAVAFGGQTKPNDGVLNDVPYKTSNDVEAEVETYPRNKYLHELLFAKAAIERFAEAETDPDKAFGTAALDAERFRLRRLAVRFMVGLFVFVGGVVCLSVRPSVCVGGDTGGGHYMILLLHIAEYTYRSVFDSINIERVCMPLYNQFNS